METLENINFSHHALLFRGEAHTILTLLEEKFGSTFRTHRDEDIRYIVSESLGIDEVRRLTFLAPTRPVANDVFRIIVVADNITFESQNALLKLTEDPPPHARFIFIVPSSLLMLPTLQSRFVEYAVGNESVNSPSVEVSIAESLKHIAVLTKNKNDAGMENMLKESEVRIHKGKVSTEAGRALILARRYIESRGSSPKILLEHLKIAEAESRLR